MKNLNDLFNLLLRNSDKRMQRKDPFISKEGFIEPFLYYTNLIGSTKHITGKYCGHHYWVARLPYTKK